MTGAGGVSGLFVPKLLPLSAFATRGAADDYQPRRGPL